MKDQIQSAQIVLPCANLNQTLEFFTEKLGFRLELIFPADSPSTAVVSGYGITLSLQESDVITPITLRLIGEFSASCDLVSPDGIEIIFVNSNKELEIPNGTNEFVITRLENENSWNIGRAGMQYRDLIPSRLGGRFIASHIRIPQGGEIPDYVHYHKVRFQMIYCLSGWAELIYEDQGEPFKMNAGDCVLQPPEIRHQVLECSDKFEVLEIGCPAIHETFAEHYLKLPNDKIAIDRNFNGQYFVHHISESENWENSEFENIEIVDCGIAKATNDLADVRKLRAVSNAKFSIKNADEFLFFFISKGKLSLLDSKNIAYSLNAGSSIVLPSDKKYYFDCEIGLEMIQVKI